MARGAKPAAATVAAALLVAGLVAWGPLRGRPGAPPAPAGRPVAVRPVPRRTVPVPPMPAEHPAPVSWPAAGTGTAVFAAATTRAVTDPGAGLLAGPTGGSVRAGTLPVWVGPPAGTDQAGSPAVSRATVSMGSQPAAAALGVHGVVFQAFRADGTAGAGRVHLSLDYGGFARAYGGDYASRLRLVELPACALTTPRVPDCRRQTPVASAADPAAARVGADVLLPASGAVFAATSTTQGSAGNFGAEPVSEEGEWVTGGPSGAYTYAYQVQVPPVPGGLAPPVTLNYSSQTVDGFNASTNNQASWVGDGWTYEPGFVEADFPTCATNPLEPDTLDLCAAPEQLTLTMNGQTTPLVVTSTGAIHPEADGAQQVIATAAGGYEVVEPNGTQYWFGLNKLPGWAAGNPTTNSRWTVPVWQGTGFATTTWRWMLDYVVDARGNALAYFYNTQTNYYAEGNGQSEGTVANGAYTQGGTLAKVEYGLRTGNAYSQTPAAQVLFATSATRQDAPHDLACAQGAPCTVNAPTFWTDHALTGITTQSLVGGAMRTVDSWALAQTYPATNDPTSAPQLWLSSITRTGQDGDTPVVLPPVSFAGTAMPNLAATATDRTAGYALVTRYRLTSLTSETGAVTTVGYSAESAACAAGTFPKDQANTGLCYPDYWWTDPFTLTDREDWYNLYDVATITTADTTGGSSPVVTSYSYGGPAWHYDNDTVSRSANWTWDQWRGFRTVTIENGAAPDQLTETVDTYFQGMSQDQSDYRFSGGVVSNGTVNLTSSHGDAVEDKNQNAGTKFEEIVYVGAGTGSQVEDTIWFPFTSTATGTNTTLRQASYVTGTASITTYTALAGGGSRKGTTTYTYNGYGQVLTENKVPDTADTTQNTCTSNTYTVNTTVWIVNLPGEVKVTGGTNCATAVSDTKYTFDGGTLTAGNVTQTSQLGATASGGTVTRSATYDGYGRVLTATDADQRTTTTAYTPATGAQPTAVVVTDPAGLSTTTTYDPARGQATGSTDPAGYQSATTYDALGRPTASWTPGNPTSGPPVDRYTYTLSNSAPSVTVRQTEEPGGGYRTAATLYDSMGRDRETQTQTAGGGSDVTDVTYDSRGLKALSSDAYYIAAAPSGTLVAAAPTSVPSQTGYVYDGDGRLTRTIAYALGVETWETDTTYGGNYATVVPPTGGVSQTTFTDGRGLTTAIYTYHGGVPASPTDPAADYDKTAYRYTPAEKLTGITDAAGDTWSATYDQLGDQLTWTTPDAGTVTRVYDNAGQLTSTTDARGKRVSTTYDPDGRPTARYDTTGTQIAAWTYDTLAKGKPTAATSYVGGSAYTRQVTAYNAYGLPASSQTVIPAAQGALAGTYTRQFTYAPGGQPMSYTDQAAGGLPAETVSLGYDAVGEPDSLTGAAPYVGSLSYTNLGQPLQYQLGTGATAVYVTDAYDPQTSRLTERATATGTAATTVDDQHYGYDQVGNVTSEADTPAGAPGATDVQCFRYDYLARLTQAWAQGSTGCAATAAASVEGGAAPYWNAYAYNPIGDLTGVTSTTPGGTVTTTTDGYGPAQPHALATAQVTSGTGSTSTSYAYDVAGDLTGVTGTAQTQALTWTDAGQLGQVVTTPSGGSPQTTSYVYDAGGNLLLTADPGTTTLYLDDEELALNTSTGAVTGTRYYNIAGTAVASRTGAGAVAYLTGDLHGTDSVAVDAATLTVTRRYYDPFGNARGTAPAGFPTGRKGFVGGVADPVTGLTNLGAREYQPATASFIAPDPLTQPYDPQHLNPYAYAADNPTTLSDPSGAIMINADGCVGSVQACEKKSAADHRPPKAKPAPHSKASQGVDYVVIEVSYTLRLQIGAPKVTMVRPVIPYVGTIPIGANKDEMPALDPLACGATFTYVVCTKRPGTARGRGNGGLQPVYWYGLGKEQPYFSQKYLSLTVSVALIIARNGHGFLSVGLGVSTGPDEPGWSVGVSVRAGVFATRQPLSSKQIDEELTGPFMSVGGHMGFLGGAVERSPSTGVVSMEYGLEGSRELVGDAYGAQIEFGWSFRIW